MQLLQALAPTLSTEISDAIEALGGQETGALLILDDFYFIPRNSQPDVLAYLHQVVRGTGVWLKIGAVEHRLNSFREGDPPAGLQPDQDAGLLRIDAALKEFQSTQNFLEGILEGISKVSSVTLDDLITHTGRQRLVMASGGVPRDYLNLTSKALAKATTRDSSSARPRNRINAEDVSEVAPSLLDQKQADLALDADPAKAESLRNRFNHVATFCTRRLKRNIFLVEATKLSEEQWGQEINALSELRFFHPVGSTTVQSSSARYVGVRYEAFALDLGAYVGSRVARNMKSIEYWTPVGAQELRAASLVYDPTTNVADKADDAPSKLAEVAEITEPQREQLPFPNATLFTEAT